MERAVDILMGAVAGVLVGLVAVLFGMLGTMGSTPPGTTDSCAGMMVAAPVVGALCGGLVAWRRGR